MKLFITCCKIVTNCVIQFRLTLKTDNTIYSAPLLKVNLHLLNYDFLLAIVLMLYNLYIFPVLQRNCGKYRSFQPIDGAIILHITK